MSVIINGSAGVTTNSGAVYNGIQGGTAVSASGTSVNFTDIPSWVKRITVMFSGVSTNGSSTIQVQIGAGSFQTSSYLGSVGYMGALPILLTTGFGIANAIGAGTTLNGVISIVLLNSSGIWSSSSNMGDSAVSNMWLSGGSKNISGTLDRVRITTVGGTDTFDAGSINILYE